MFFTFLLLLLSYFIIQSPTVQQYLVNQATTKLSEDLKTTVRIDGVQLKLFNQVVLEKVYIQDQVGDTLIYVGQLSATMKGTFFSFLFNEIEFEKISLGDARINLRRRAGEYDDSLKFLLDYFKSPKKDPPEPPSKPSPFRLNIQNLTLNNVTFFQEDAKSGQDMHIHVNRANFRLEYFDQVKNEMIAPSLNINGFQWVVTEYEKTRLPEREKEPEYVFPDSIAHYVAPFFTTKIQAINLENGYFQLDRNQIRKHRIEYDSVMDYNHLKVYDIALRVDKFVGNEDLAFSGNILHFSAREGCGFYLEHAESNDVVVTDKKTILKNLRMQTNKSDFGGLFEMHYETYRDYRKFENNVKMVGDFRDNSKIGFRDIMFFSPPVHRNKFFKKNKDRFAELSGSIQGSVNNLKGRDIKLKIGSKGYLGGNFDFEDVFDGVVPRMAFNFDDLRTDMQTIRDLIPGFSAPAYFDRLGQISTDSAYYNIIFGTDHILGGRFMTDLGGGQISMQMVLPSEGREKATYSGKLGVVGFDLGAWTGNKDFTETSFNIDLDESSGLTQATINARLKGQLVQLGYKGFSYQNIYVNGAFDGPRFDGDMRADGEELAFDFRGKVDFRDSLPTYSFDAEVQRLNLKSLQLLKKDWVLAGKIEHLNLRGSTLDNLAGDGLIRDFVILENGTDQHGFDSLAFSLDYNNDNQRNIRIDSDILNLDMHGQFAPERIPSDLTYLFYSSFPDFAQNMGVKAKDSWKFSPPQSSFDFGLVIRDSKSFLSFFGLGKDTLEALTAIGNVDLSRKKSNLTIFSPYLKFGKLKAYQTEFEWKQENDSLTYSLYVPESSIAKYKQGVVALTGSLINSGLNFDIQHKNANSALSSVSLKGMLSSLGDKNWNLQFSPSDIHLFSDVWALSPENFVTFGNNKFNTENFELFSSDDKRIYLSSIGTRGLSLAGTNFDLSFLDNFLKIKDVTYKGEIDDIDLHVNDVFKMEGIELFLGIDSFQLKEYPYGFVSGYASMANLKSPLVFDMAVSDIDKGYSLTANGAWLMGGDSTFSIAKLGPVRPKEFQLLVHANDFPIDILERYIPGISNTKGKLNGAAQLGGPFSRPDMNGKVYIEETSVQLNYLKTDFIIKKQPILLNSYQIWADGDTIYDASGTQMARVRGGLRHDHFKSWTIDCGVESIDNQFKILDTKKNDNELFYGTAFGKIKADFSGTFNKTNMAISGTTGRNTVLYLPFEGGGDASAVNFIKFVDKKAPEKDPDKPFTGIDLKGIDLTVDLTITEDAEIQMILDEKAGDIVKGVGTGNLQMTYDRTAEFKMYGNYYIKRGKYLFTLLNFINKPFTVDEGGTINWFGDPYGATVDLNAKYTESTSLTNFIQSQLENQASEELTSQAGLPTQVELNMHLSGDLFKPNIGFSFAFPNLSSDLRNLVDNQMRLLDQDVNEINRQVFGLMVMGGFLPSDATGFTAGAPVVNTISQFLSSQFSNYLTGLASEWFDGTVSSIGLNIAYNEYTNVFDNGPVGSEVGRDLQVRLRSGFKNERVVVQFGSQFGLFNQNLNSFNQNGFLGEDVTVEIALTQNRQWKLKVYQRLEPQIAGVDQYSWRFGGGISFQKEYDSLQNVLDGLGKNMRKEKRKARRANAQ